MDGGRRGASSLERQKVRGPPPHPSSSFSSNSNTPASRTQLPHPRLPGSLAGLPMGRACGWWQAERFGGARADKLSPAGVWRDPMTFHRHPSFPSSSSVMLPPLPLVLSLLLLHSRHSKDRERGWRTAGDMQGNRRKDHAENAHHPTSTLSRGRLCTSCAAVAAAGRLRTKGSGGAREQAESRRVWALDR